MQGRWSKSVLEFPQTSYSKYNRVINTLESCTWSNKGNGRRLILLMESDETVADWKQAIKAEIKQLRGDIMALKKSATKGDKKAKKEIQDRVTEMESLLASKQAILSSGVDPSQESPHQEAASEQQPQEQASLLPNELYLDQGVSKKQSKKEKKAATSSARAAALRSAPRGPDFSALEQQKLEGLLIRERLEIFDMDPDGHCMFNAVAHQLNLIDGSSYGYQDLRRIAADYILENSELYSAFIDDDEGSKEVNDGIEGYCEKVRSTTLWGGHVEVPFIMISNSFLIQIYSLMH